jgi:hypothetical protein
MRSGIQESIPQSLNSLQSLNLFESGNIMPRDDLGLPSGNQKRQPETATRSGNQKRQSAGEKRNP